MKNIEALSISEQVKTYQSITATTHFIFVYPEKASKNDVRVFFSVVPLAEIEPFFVAGKQSGATTYKPRFRATTTDKHVLEAQYGKHYLCMTSELDTYLAACREAANCKPSKLNRGHAAEYALCERVFDCAWESIELDKPHTVAGDISANGNEYQVKYVGGWL